MTSATNELRLAVIFRTDIDMPRGKSEVQFGHAVWLLRTSYDSVIFVDYDHGTHLKLSMEVDNLHELEKIVRRAELRGVPCVTVTDAGRTVFGEPTVTCIGLGPMNKTDCNALTRHARMRV